MDQPKLVEVLVDGQRVHSFLSEEFASTESQETLILNARRWFPAVLHNPENPFFGLPTGTPIDGLFVTEEKADAV